MEIEKTGITENLKPMLMAQHFEICMRAVFQFKIFVECFEVPESLAAGAPGCAGRGAGGFAGRAEEASGELLGQRACLVPKQNRHDNVV